MKPIIESCSFSNASTIPVALFEPLLFDIPIF